MRGGGEDGDLARGVPKCEHGELALLQDVKKNSANKGRQFFSCYMPMRGRGRGKGGWGGGKSSRCNFFKWADDVSGAMVSNPVCRSQFDRFVGAARNARAVRSAEALVLCACVSNTLDKFILV
jgi:hypothetical protein